METALPMCGQAAKPAGAPRGCGDAAPSRGARRRSRRSRPRGAPRRPSAAAAGMGAPERFLVLGGPVSAVVVGRRHGRLSVGRARPRPWGRTRDLLRRSAGVRPAGPLRVDRERVQAPLHGRRQILEAQHVDVHALLAHHARPAGDPHRVIGQIELDLLVAGQRPRARDPHPGRAEFDGLRRDRRADAPAQRARDRDQRSERALAQRPLAAGAATVRAAPSAAPHGSPRQREPPRMARGRGPGGPFRAAEAQEQGGEGLLLHRRGRLLKGTPSARARCRPAVGRSPRR